MGVKYRPGHAAALRQKLTNNVFVITAEINPPRGADPSRVLAKIAEIRPAVDAVNIADSPMAKMRMNPAALAHIVQEELGVETIVHFTCRDRNSIALQSDILGAYALGIRNLLVITGDRPPTAKEPASKPAGQRAGLPAGQPAGLAAGQPAGPTAYSNGFCPRAVFDMDAAGLVGLAAALNGGYDLADNKLSCAPDCFVGVVANPSAPDLDREIERLERKVSAGAKFVQTQPIYNVKVLQRFKEKTAHLMVPIIYGILPLKNYDTALYLHEKVPGVTIPEDVRERVRLGGRRAGVELARELFVEIHGQVDGVHIFPMGDTDMVLEVTEGYKRRPALATLR